MSGTPKRRRFRFSLRTLLVAVLLLGSATALWLNWQPWYKLSTLSGPDESIRFASFSEDCSRVIWLGEDCVVHVMDARTSAVIATQKMPDAEIHAEGIYAGHAILVTAGHVDTPPAEEAWRVDFRSRHPKPMALNFQVGTLDEALEMLMTNRLHEKFVYNQEVIDSGRTQKVISPADKELDPLAILTELLEMAELAPEFEDGAVHVVRKETYLAHRVQKEDTTVRVWELETGKQIATLNGQTSKITAVAISPDGTHVLAASESATVRIWETGGLQTALLHTGDSPLICAALSNNGQRVAGAIKLTKIGAWNTQNDSNIFTSVDLGSTHAVSVSSDGSFAAFHYGFKSVELWDLNAGSRLKSLLRQFIGDSFEMAPVFSPRGDRILVVCAGQSWLISPHDDKEVALYRSIRSAQFSFDCQRLAATYHSSGSAIFNAENGELLTYLPDDPRRLGDILHIFRASLRTTSITVPSIESPIATPQFSPDRKQVIATDSKGRLGVWNFRRNEAWWGVATLFEFWLTVVFAGAIVWSIRRDKRET